MGTKTNIQVTSLSYVHKGFTYAMNILGDEEEVNSHIANLKSYGVKNLAVQGKLLSIQEVDLEQGINPSVLKAMCVKH